MIDEFAQKLGLESKLVYVDILKSFTVNENLIFHSMISFCPFDKHCLMNSTNLFISRI